MAHIGGIESANLLVVEILRPFREPREVRTRCVLLVAGDADLEGLDLLRGGDVSVRIFQKRIDLGAHVSRPAVVATMIADWADHDAVVGDFVLE